jgi:hypothetical protein
MPPTAVGRDGAAVQRVDWDEQLSYPGCWWS